MKMKPPHTIRYNGKTCQPGEPVDVLPADTEALRAEGWTDDDAAAPKKKKEI